MFSLASNSTSCLDRLPWQTKHSVKVSDCDGSRLGYWANFVDIFCRTNYYQRIVKESWFINLEQTPLNRCLQLLLPYKRLFDDINNRQTTDWPTTTHVQTLDQQKTDRNAPITVYSTTEKQQTDQFTNNTSTDIRLTQDESKRTNHCVQSSQPLTTRLNWQLTINVTNSLTNHINDQSQYLYHPLTLHKSLNSDDDFRSGCQNVSQCHL